MINWRKHKKTLRVGLAICVAALIGFYFSNHQLLWVVLTTFLVSQTTQGTPLRQAILFFLIIVSAVVVASLLNRWLAPMALGSMVGSVFVLSAAVAYANRPLLAKTNFQWMLFSVVLLIAAFSPTRMAPLSEQLMAVGVGAVVGVLFNQFVFPTRLQEAFCQGVLPVLKLLEQYSLALKASASTNRTNLSTLNVQVEKALLIQQSMYPEWVFEVGFNPGLRSSWRFFLVQIERMTELFFSLDYLFAQNNRMVAMDEMAVVLQKNSELLAILIHYFETNEYKKTESDYSSDLTALENTVQQFLPQQVELLDLSADYLVLAAIVRDLRDLRGLLLELLLALPGK